MSEAKTKSGHSILRADFITEVSVADAQRYHAKVIPGGQCDGFGHLAVGNVTGVSGDVRKVLSSRKSPENPPPVAVVMSAALATTATPIPSRPRQKRWSGSMSA